MAFLAMPSSTPAAPRNPVGHTRIDVDLHETDAADDAAKASGAHAADASHGDTKGHGKKKEKTEEKGHGDKKEQGSHGDPHGETVTGPKHSDAEEVDLGNFTVSGFQPASNSTL